MNLKDFDKALSNHDWYSNFSDDHSVWAAGDRQYKVLVDISKSSDQHAKLFSSWKEHFFSGSTFATPEFTKQMLDDIRTQMGVI